MTTVLNALAQIEAARDSGDHKGDKVRKRTIAALMKRANQIAAKLPSEDAYPEVASALSVVSSLADVAGKLSQQYDHLKMAPAGSTEAVEAQKDIDHTRRNVDAMLKPMESTMETLENLLDAAMEMEETYRKLQLQLAGMNDSLKREKTRLASVAQAISNAAKIA